MLKFTVVLLLVIGGSDVFFLAGGYVAAGVLGVSIYVVMLVRMLRTEGLFNQLRVRSIEIPVREILVFTVPLLSTDLVYVLMTSMDAVLLGYFGGTTDVALFRAVQPAARLNQVVFTSFTLLFTPLAARMYERQDRQEINNMYWQTAIWIATISFPIFVLTFSLASPLTVLVYGERYAQSAPILALLSFGYYFNAALGFNGTTLTVFRKIRYIIIINIIAAVINIGVNLLLIPKYGAFGAAVGTCLTLVVHNILKQIGLSKGTGISLFASRYLKIYASILFSALAVLVYQVFTSMPVVVDFLVAAVVSFVVVWSNRKALNVEETFPELLRLPMMRRIFGS